MAGEEIRAIDYWINDFSPEGLKELGEEMWQVMKWWGLKNEGYSIREFVELAKKNGVDKFCYASTKMWSYQKHTWVIHTPEERVAKAVAECPDNIMGVYGIDPRSGMTGVRELEKWIKERGFKAAQIHPYGFGFPVDDRRYYPFYTKCCELDVPVIMQTGHSAEVMPSDLSRPVRVDYIACDFPELKLIASHTGWPWVEELIAIAWKHPNVYLGVAAHAPKYWDPSLVRFINTRGQDKCIWGTDWPLLTHDRSLKELSELNIKEEPKKKLLRDNAIKVFKLGQK